MVTCPIGAWLRYKRFVAPTVASVRNMAQFPTLQSVLAAAAISYRLKAQANNLLLLRSITFLD